MECGQEVRGQILLLLGEGARRADEGVALAVVGLSLGVTPNTLTRLRNDDQRFASVPDPLPEGDGFLKHLCSSAAGAAAA